MGESVTVPDPFDKDVKAGLLEFEAVDNGATPIREGMTIELPVDDKPRNLTLDADEEMLAECDLHSWPRVRQPRTWPTVAERSMPCGAPGRRGDRVFGHYGLHIVTDSVPRPTLPPSDPLEQRPAVTPVEFPDASGLQP